MSSVSYKLTLVEMFAVIVGFQALSEEGIGKLKMRWLEIKSKQVE